MPKAIKVGMVTQQQDAYLPDYFGPLAKIDEVESVALADPSGQSGSDARKALGDKLRVAFKDPAQLYQRFAPHLAVVSREPVAARAAIDAALDAGCHVFTR